MAVKHLHDKNIAHRDIKPENIILYEKELGALSPSRRRRPQERECDCEFDIKLIDFGFSKPFQVAGEKQSLDTKIGTPYFIAPEILKGEYNQECDLWSIGVLTFILLYGGPPFTGNNETQVYNKIRTCDYIFPEKQNISK
jgi:calcium-dependent protein kinase